MMRRSHRLTNFAKRSQLALTTVDGARALTASGWQGKRPTTAQLRHFKPDLLAVEPVIIDPICETKPTGSDEVVIIQRDLRNEANVRAHHLFENMATCCSKHSPRRSSPFEPSPPVMIGVYGGDEQRLVRVVRRASHDSIESGARFRFLDFSAG